MFATIEVRTDLISLQSHNPKKKKNRFTYSSAGIDAGRDALESDPSGREHEHWAQDLQDQPSQHLEAWRPSSGQPD